MLVLALFAIALIGLDWEAKVITACYNHYSLKIPLCITQSCITFIGAVK